MNNHYHIVNGDSLKEQFPKEIDGEIIIARECLVDGEVRSENLEELFQVRARFITETYGDYSLQEYYNHTVTEFEKIQNLPIGATINLWFEDDLFCQVNFWFVAYLLSQFVENCDVFLVRPKVHDQFGFGGLNKAELKQVFEERVQLTEINKIAQLWKSYRNEELDALLDTAKELKEPFPFILTAVRAHIARIPTKNDPGRPVRTLREIMKELDTEEFGPVFREFNMRESIYGFGDLQVKRLFDEILNDY